MNKAPAFQHYPDKWITDTKRLSWATKGIYRELLDVIWMQFQDTCSIPDDDGFIASEIGCTVDEWKSARVEIQNIHRPLMIEVDGKLHSKGLFKEHKKQKERREKLSANGKLGGRPSHNKANEKQLVSEEKQKPTLPSPIPSPSPVPTEVNNTYVVAKKLATELLDRTSRAVGRKLISTVGSSAKEIEKLLKKDIPQEQIGVTIDWLVTDNLTSGYPFVVESGKSLHQKWDKIQAQMCKKEHRKKSSGNVIGMGK